MRWRRAQWHDVCLPLPREKKGSTARVEPKVETSVEAGFEGGGTVARQGGSGLREEEQPDPGVEQGNMGGGELRCIDTQNMGRPTAFGNHVSGMAAMHLPHGRICVSFRTARGIQPVIH
jgi:hypothetical protein